MGIAAKMTDAKTLMSDMPKTLSQRMKSFAVSELDKFAALGKVMKTLVTGETERRPSALVLTRREGGGSVPQSTSCHRGRPPMSPGIPKVDRRIVDLMEIVVVPFEQM